MYFEKIKVLIKKFCLDYLLIAILACIVFSFIQADPSFADPDAFYHLKIAQIIKEEGIIRYFPYQEFSTLKNFYTDHHLLYHLWLIPWISFFSPFVGLKISTIILNTFLILLFYWILKQFNQKHSFLFTVLLIANSNFLYRLSLIKATPISIIVLLLAFYCFEKKKYFTLTILGFLYVWAYGGFLLLPISALIYILSRAIVSLLNTGYIEKIHRLVPDSEKNNLKFKWRTFISSLSSSQSKKIIASSFLGIGIGIITNPYFPQNLFFYYQQIIQIGLVNFKSAVNVGTEWLNYPALNLAINNNILTLIFILSIICFIIFIKKAKTKEIFAFFLMLIFLIFTLKSRRYVEYLIPFSIIFISFATNLYFKKERKIRPLFKGAAAIIGIFVFAFLIGYNLLFVQQYFTDKIPYTKYSQSAQWLVKNTPENSLVFQSDWDDWSMLFLNNTHNRFMIGLDPTFMYKYDPKLYKIWENITTGRQDQFLYATINKHFNSDYLLIGKDKPHLLANIAKDPRFQVIFSDNDAIIYKIQK